MTDRRSVPRWARATRLVTLVCAGLLALTGCDFSVYSLPLPGGADLGDHPYSVRVQFRDVLDLVPKSSVKVDDVTVGRVDKIELRGYTADVTVTLRGDVQLPDNAEAEIRQTSLLGEKFVSLRRPAEAVSSNLLEDGDLIPLARTGRNPEVEEVLGALSLLLNGGGVGQLKTIAAELNKGLEGREPDVRSLLDQLDTFMGQLDENKGTIVTAIESLNRLAISLNKRKGSIEVALDELPAALASIDRQRDDLVKMLQALTDLSSVGTRVIRDSKAATIDSLEALAPTLTKLAEAGDALPRSLQAFLTYPFPDSVVGKDPTQARNLHMGDYTNLSVQLDLDLANGLPTLPGLPPPPSLDDLVAACGDVPVAQLSDACKNLSGAVKKQICNLVPGSPLCPAKGGGGGGGGGDLPLPLPLPGGTGGGDTGDDPSGCLLLICPRVAPGPSSGTANGPVTGPAAASADGAADYDAGLAAMLVWGMVRR